MLGSGRDRVPPCEIALEKHSLANNVFICSGSRLLRAHASWPGREERTLARTGRPDLHGVALVRRSLGDVRERNIAENAGVVELHVLLVVPGSRDAAATTAAAASMLVEKRARGCEGRGTGRKGSAQFSIWALQSNFCDAFVYDIIAGATS